MTPYKTMVTKMRVNREKHNRPRMYLRNGGIELPFQTSRFSEIKSR
jgi:hypothetical protein